MLLLYGRRRAGFLMFTQHLLVLLFSAAGRRAGGSDLFYWEDSHLFCVLFGLALFFSTVVPVCKLC
jgi:hypothetical protein